MASVTIVSNRLPISVKKVSGRLNFYPSAGGLATGLVSYTEDNHNNWVGWPGIASDKLSDAEMEQISTELATKNCYPVFLNQKQGVKGDSKRRWKQEIIEEKKGIMSGSINPHSNDQNIINLIFIAAPVFDGLI